MSKAIAVRYFEHKELRALLKRLHRAGGQSQKAADQVHLIRQRIADGEDPFRGVQVTGHGETRIENCVKYDLPGRGRLVTIQQKNIVLLRYVGVHADVDGWLERNRGLRAAVSENGDFREIMISSDIDQPTNRIGTEPDNYSGPLLVRLDLDYRAKLFGDLPSRITEPLREIQAGTDEQALHYHVLPIPDEGRRKVIFDVFALLNSGDIQGAQNRIDVAETSSEGAKLKLVERLSDDEILRIRDGEFMREIQIGSRDYEDYIDRFQWQASDLDWFLFMHPDQERFVREDYSGPAKLSGASGSGKTCIAIRRAVRLAEKYSSDQIAIVTLNRSLSSMIDRLVDHVCPAKEVRSRIKVRSFFGLCQELLSEFEPENAKLYSDITWGLEEHIDEIFREYYRCQAGFRKAEVLKPLHRSLSALGIDSETYVKEEFDWIRSVVSADERSKYLEIERAGRVYAIDRDRRVPILQALQHWEEKMTSVGVIDYLGLTTALDRHKHNIVPRFRSIIVDEVQDFGTTEVDLLRRLVPRQENDIFLCGDLAQHILPKHQSFAAANIEIAGRSHSIRRNYRNTREILRAAYEVLYSNLDEALLRGGDMEIFNPEYATRSSSVPMVLSGDSLEQEFACAMALMADNAALRRERGDERGHRGCIAIAGYSHFELKIFGDKHGIPVLDGTQDYAAGDLFLSDLEQTKGYEFDTVVVLNCKEDVLPPAGAPKEETFRFGCQLYVAMTRARDQLVLSYSGKPSPWLTAESGVLNFDTWESFVDVAEIKQIGQPGFLAEVPDSEDVTQSVMKMTGQEFNYTVYARGLSPEIQERLEEAVSGRAVSRGRMRVNWESVGQLLSDMQLPRTGYVFGPVADKQVLSVLERAHSGLRPTAQKMTKKRVISIPPLPEIPSQRSIASGGNSPTLLQMSVRDLQLDASTVLALEIERIKNVKDLLATRSLDLRRSPTFGARRIDQIRSSLKRLGFTW